MKVAFNAGTPVSYTTALDTAKRAYPHINFSATTDPVSLERTLIDNGVVLFVESQQADFTTNERLMAADIDAEIGEACQLPSIPEDVSVPIGFDVCAPIDEQPQVEHISTLDIEAILGNMDIAAQKQIDKAMSCVDQMQQISEDLGALQTAEQSQRQVLFQLDELYYQYRLINAFYLKRLTLLDSVLSAFAPLVTQKIDSTTKITALQQQLINANVTEKAGIQSQIDIESAKLADTQLKIDMQKMGQPILLETFTNSSGSFQEPVLENLLDALQHPTSGISIFLRVPSFSEKTDISPLSAASGGVSFEAKIHFTFDDPDGVLNGRSNKFLEDLKDFNNKKEPKGDLYDKLYNIAGDPNKFFADIERGVSDDGSSADPRAGSGQIDGKFVSDFDKFQEFYKNFGERWQARFDQVKQFVIEPALQNIVGGMEDYATQEVLYYLAFAKVFEVLPATDAKLAGTVAILRSTAEAAIEKGNDLLDTITWLKSLHQQTLNDISLKQMAFEGVPCALRDGPEEPDAKKEAGNDPLGLVSLREFDPENPDPTKFCYWVKFAKLATLVGLLPLPGPGGLRYWPIGFVVPTPAKLVKIPLPIIWIPLTVIALPIGIFVVFIGQCGICPSPFVLYIGSNGEKKFIVSLRKTDDFGSDASNPVMKTIQHGGIALMQKLEDLTAKFTVPGKKDQKTDSRDTFLTDIKEHIMKSVNKLDGVKMGPVLSINAGSTLAEKKVAFKKTVMSHLDNLEIPSIKIPKKGANVNPKPKPTEDVIDQLKTAASMRLPEISIPELQMISLKDKLMEKFDKLHLTDFEDIPPADDKSTDEQKEKHVSGFRKAINKAAAFLAKEITPTRLGIVTQATEGIKFVNPYVCRPKTDGLVVPPVPPAVLLGIGALTIAAKSIADGLTFKDVIDFGGGKPITKSTLKEALKRALDRLPPFNVPDPSKISLKHIAKDSSIKLSKIQMPSFPDLTKALQPRVSIPGTGIKSAILSAVESAIDALPTPGIDFTTANAVDMKQISTEFVEGTFTQLEKFFDPFINIVSKYKAAKDKGFAETLGLKKVNKDDESVPIIPKEAFEKAMKALEAIELVPFPVVAAAPGIFSKLHPILGADDLPPWERLTLSNFLLVVFLDDWCRQGKKGGGLFENPM